MSTRSRKLGGSGGVTVAVGVFRGEGGAAFVPAAGAFVCADPGVTVFVGAIVLVCVGTTVFACPGAAVFACVGAAVFPAAAVTGSGGPCPPDFVPLGASLTPFVPPAGPL